MRNANFQPHSDLLATVRVLLRQRPDMSIRAIMTLLGIGWSQANRLAMFSYSLAVRYGAIVKFL